MIFFLNCFKFLDNLGMHFANLSENDFILLDTVVTDNRPGVTFRPSQKGKIALKGTQYIAITQIMFVTALETCFMPLLLISYIGETQSA